MTNKPDNFFDEVLDYFLKRNKKDSTDERISSSISKRDEESFLKYYSNSPIKSTKITIQPKLKDIPVVTSPTQTPQNENINVTRLEKTIKTIKDILNGLIKTKKVNLMSINKNNKTTTLSPEKIFNIKNTTNILRKMSEKTFHNLTENDFVSQMFNNVENLSKRTQVYNNNQVENLSKQSEIYNQVENLSKQSEIYNQVENLSKQTHTLNNNNIKHFKKENTNIIENILHTPKENITKTINKIIPSIDINSLPSFAMGGVVSSPTVAVVGDAPTENFKPNPEYVVGESYMTKLFGLAREYYDSLITPGPDFEKLVEATNAQNRMGIKLNDENSTARETSEAINSMQKNKELQQNENMQQPVNSNTREQDNRRIQSLIQPTIPPSQVSSNSKSGDFGSNRLRENNNAYKQYPRWRRILG
jgi:hypothetical protein